MGIMPELLLNSLTRVEWDPAGDFLMLGDDTFGRLSDNGGFHLGGVDPALV